MSQAQVAVFVMFRSIRSNTKEKPSDNPPLRKAGRPIVKFWEGSISRDTIRAFQINRRGNYDHQRDGRHFQEGRTTGVARRD